MRKVLFETIWADAEVEDANLTNNITVLRRILGARSIAHPKVRLPLLHPSHSLTPAFVIRVGCQSSDSLFENAFSIRVDVGYGGGVDAQIASGIADGFSVDIEQLATKEERADLGLKGIDGIGSAIFIAILAIGNEDLVASKEDMGMQARNTFAS